MKVLKGFMVELVYDLYRCSEERSSNEEDMEIKDGFVLGDDQEQSHLNVRISSANAKVVSILGISISALACTLDLCGRLS